MERSVIVKPLKIPNTRRICVFVTNATLDQFVAHGPTVQRAPWRLYCLHKSNKAVEH